MSGVWIVEFKSALFQGWIPVSSIGVHSSMNSAKLASRALDSDFKLVRVRDLEGGDIVYVREADSGWYCGSLLLVVIIFLLMGVI